MPHAPHLIICSCHIYTGTELPKSQDTCNFYPFVQTANLLNGILFLLRELPGSSICLPPTIEAPAVTPRALRRSAPNTTSSRRWRPLPSTRSEPTPTGSPSLRYGDEVPVGVRPLRVDGGGRRLFDAVHFAADLLRVLGVTAGASIVGCP